MKPNFEIVTSLQHEVKRLRAQVEAYRSGEKFLEMNERLRLLASEKNKTIARLGRELSAANSALVTMREKWFQAAEDIEKGHKNELAKKDRLIKELEKKALKAEQSLDGARDKLRGKTRELYDALTALEDEQGRNKKLKAQLNRDYENSSAPSSMKPNRKKIANSREKTGRKPGGQPGHKGHTRKKHAAANRIAIPVPEEFLDTAKYRPTGKIISKQKVGISISLAVTEYVTPEYRSLSSGRRVHAAFPGGMANEVCYDGSIKAFAYLLNNRACVSIDKVREFLSEITNGELNVSKGMVSGLGREFSRKTERERREIFSGLLRAPVMNADFSVVRLNGKNTSVAICANPAGAMYFARGRKGHEGVRGTPVEDYQGVLVHDHDKTFYSYGARHQECMAHVLRYLKDSMENEPGLKWNKQMRELIREMIHYRNSIPTGAGTDPGKVEKLVAEYREILGTAKDEYEYEPPSRYYREGYNLFRRLDKYRESHLLFLHDTGVPATNNLSERLLRVLKRKAKQVMAFRSENSVEYLCNGMGVIASLRAQDENLYRSVSNIFN